MTEYRQYLAANLSDAAARIKGELGVDAVIVQTRAVRRGPLWGLLGKPMVEVTVAEPAAAPAPRSRPAPAPAAAPARETGQLLAFEEMRRDVEAIRSMLEQTPPTPSRRTLPPLARALLGDLRRQGVEEELALRLVSPVRGGREANQATARSLVQLEVLQVLGSPGPLPWETAHGAVVAFVGPTGVGKTTSIAKLAAQLALTARRKVGVLCTDTQRVGAEMQLRSYCELIGVPFLVADTPGEIALARRRLNDCDLILADTAGTGPRDSRGLGRLQAQLEALAPQAIPLVLSLTTSEGDAGAMASVFNPLGCTHLLPTKLDETAAPGRLLNLRVTVDRPICYVGTGQRVPDDLQPLDAGAYCASLLSPSSAAGEVGPT